MPTFTAADFEESDACEIDNPLRNLLPDELNARAVEFAKLVSQPHPGSSVSRLFAKLTRWAHSPHNALHDFDDETSTTNEDLILLFAKAALVAQNAQTPRRIESLGLNAYETALLKSERDVKFWDQPKMLRVTVVTLCFSAIIQGWIQSSSNGANQYWPAAFCLVDKDGHLDGQAAIWIFSGVNAITYLAASICGCWLSDPLQARLLGRRGAIFASGLMCLASLIGSACTRNWWQLLVCRALVGLGMGAKASVTPIFGAEISPSHLRGALVMNWQLFDAFGIFLGFSANLILLNTGIELSWRLQYASACLPTLCLLTLIWIVPESPRWLLKQRRYQEAFAALCSFRSTHLQAAVELFYANAQLQKESELPTKKLGRSQSKRNEDVLEHVENVTAYQDLTSFQDLYDKTNYYSRFLRLFSNERTRRATVAALVVMLSQQLCGINVLAFYSSTFFHDPGTPSWTPNPQCPQLNGQVIATPELASANVRALWLSWGVGLINFLFTFPAYYMIDTHGRRFLLFCTYPGMILSLLGACLSFFAQNPAAPVGVFSLVFVTFYSWGQGPVAFAYSSEVFPLINREAGMSFAVFVNLLGAGVLTLLVPQASDTSNALGSLHNHNIGQVRLLAIFIGFNILAVILIFFFVPETAGVVVRKEGGHLNYMKLEDLHYIFEVPTSDQVSYQLNQMLPYAMGMARWWTCRWFVKSIRKPTKPKEMWAWADSRNSDASGHSSGAQLEEMKEANVSQRSSAHAMSPD